MIRLQAPKYNIGAVYSSCANRTVDPQLKAALIAERARVVARSESYLLAADDLTFYSLQPEMPQNLVREDLAGIYERVLVKGGERAIYLGIRAAAYMQRCPLCAHRDVTTLDHYLPKENYPEFAVLPANLVPCCEECNGAKSTFIPAAAEEQLFHPYFDDWAIFSLLRADVIVTQYVDVDFYIDPDAAPTDIAERAQKHFDRLGLADLYSSNAAVELISKRSAFLEHFEAGGAEALESELDREAESRLVPFRNGWQPALYRALADSETFCTGGFLNIETPAQL
jgi:hypothetical protein